jgi:hypothetical protein
MVSVFSLWLPILLSAVAVFVASSVIWMFLPWHKGDYKGVPDEAAAGAALRGLPPGSYNIPHLESRGDMSTPEGRARFEKGPVAFLFVAPKGLPSMGPMMGKWFVFAVVVAFCVAYVAGIGLAPGADYMAVMRLTATATWMAYGFAFVADSIWYFRPWHLTWKNLFDALIYGLLSGGIFGWLWPEA